MFKNYLKVAFRNIVKYKAFSFINIFGLAVAMSLCMLIILMLADRYRYDQFNEFGDRIYRLRSSTLDSKQPYATSPEPVSEALTKEYPIIEVATHITPGVGGDATFNQRIAEVRGYFASPSFF